MSKSKKILLFIFTITLVVNLQLTGNLSSGMEQGFSLEQLADKLFIPSAFAGEDYRACFLYGEHACQGYPMPEGYYFYLCAAAPGYVCYP